MYLNTYQTCYNFHFKRMFIDTNSQCALIEQKEGMNLESKLLHILLPLPFTPSEINPPQICLSLIVLVITGRPKVYVHFFPSFFLVLARPTLLLNQM